MSISSPVMVDASWCQEYDRVRNLYWYVFRASHRDSVNDLAQRLPLEGFPDSVLIRPGQTLLIVIPLPRSLEILGECQHCCLRCGIVRLRIRRPLSGYGQLTILPYFCWRMTFMHFAYTGTARTYLLQRFSSYPQASYLPPLPSGRSCVIDQHINASMSFYNVVYHLLNGCLIRRLPLRRKPFAAQFFNLLNRVLYACFIYVCNDNRCLLALQTSW